MKVGKQSKLEKKDNIKNYADLFISHIIEDIKDVKSDYKHIVRQVAKKMLEEIK